MSREPGVCKYEEKDYEMVYSFAETNIESHNLGLLIHDMMKGKIRDDMSMQRDANQWSLKDKSMLMHTVFINLSIIPISLIQNGSGGGIVRYLLDGKQRMSNFYQFYNNEFKLSAATPHVKMRRIIKQPKLDEHGKEVKELINGKKRVVMEPCYDADGKIMTEEIEYKVAGKYFSELPDALKDQFESYKYMPQYVHVNYSDEEIQMQMLRDNTSVKMTPAQIGSVLCGEDLAQWQKEFRDHDLFLSNSTWTANQEKKSLIERCIVESFVLSMFDDAWNQNHIKNVETFTNNASKEMLSAFSDIVDEFNNVVKEFPTLKQYLTKDNLHIIIGVFRRFCDMSERYKRDVFGKFLYEWFAHIKDEVGYEVEGNAGTKKKKTITDKLSLMESSCIDYVTKYGEEVPEDELYSDGVSALNKFVEEYKSINLPHADKSTALKSLIAFTNYPYNNYEENNIADFERWVKRNYSDSQEFDDCILWAEVLKDKLSASDLFAFNANDIPVLIQVIKEVDDNFSDEDICAWIKSLKNENIHVTADTNAEIVSKQSLFVKSLCEYIDRKDDKNDVKEN